MEFYEMHLKNQGVKIWSYTNFRVRTLFQTKNSRTFHGLSRTLLGNFKHSFKDNFTSKPRKMFLLTPTCMFSWSSHCVEDFLRILRASCVSWLTKADFLITFRSMVLLQVNQTLCLNSWHLFEAMTYRLFFQPFFITMTPSWHCDIQLNPK